MSRLDKQQHQEQVVGTARDTSVRLFAFANTRPRYQVVFAPEEPLIILKTKKSATPQHPCQQWEPLSSLIFHARPNTTHAVYVADTTEMSSVPMHEQEEHVNGAAVGPLLKRLGNTLIRLNPHDATMVAAGASAHLGLKYVLVGEKTLGHRDRLVRRLVLVCPTPLSSLVALTNAVIKKPAAEGYPLPEVVVLLKDAAEVPAWTAWLTGLRDTHGRIASFSITTDLAPTLFAAIAREAGVAEADGTAVDVLQRHPSPRVYRIDFVLSKQTKTVIQLPRLSPLSTLGYDEDDEDDGHDHDGESAEGSEEEEEEEEGEFADDDGEEGHHAGDGAAHGHAHSTAHHHSGCGSGCCDHDHHHGDEHGNEDGDREGEGGSMLVSGVQSLAHWCDPVRVIVEGRVLDLNGGLVGTTDGCVEVPNLKEVVNADPSLSAFLTRSSSAAATAQKGKAQKPPAVAIAATLDRDDEGRTTLLAEEVRPLTKAEVRQSMTAGASLEEIPVHYNASRIAHSYGALLVRGRKCALVRNVETAHADPHLRIPSAPHSAATESSMECAVRALCDACEVSSDNFYLPSYLPPVLYYAAGDGSGVPRCVTIYTALAISPPPRGPASDAVEDAPEYGEPYDWVSFERALTVVATEAEREALREAQQHLAKAQRAGFYTPFKGCGTFGDAVRPLPGLSSGNAASAAPPLSSGSTKGSAAAAAAARSAAPARPASLAGIELYVVACPGDAANELLPMLRRALQTSSVLVCDADTTTAAIESAAAEALRCGDRSVLLYLPEDDADAEAFCEAHLVELTEERHATAQVFVALLPSVAHSILDLSGTAAVKAEAEMRLDALLSAARVSDALVTLVPPEQLSPAEVALLRVCCKANADLSLIYSWEARRPFELAEQSSSNEGAAAAAPHLKQVALTLPAGVPVAPAALAYLTHAGALDCFFMDGACRLLFAQGDVWIPTRGSTQGFVYLDVTSHCLAVEPGEEYEGQSNSTRTSALSLVLWCADAAAAAKAEAQAATMAALLQWSEERDGADWASAHDPLPKWE